MTQDEFTSFTARTIENVIKAAEAKCGHTLSREIRFQWLGHHPIDGNVVEELVSKVFVDSDHIYPCVDFGVAAIDRAGKTLSDREHRRSYAPSIRTEFGLGVTGHMFMWSVRLCSTMNSSTMACQTVPLGF